MFKFIQNFQTISDREMTEACTNLMISTTLQLKTFCRKVNTRVMDMPYIHNRFLVEWLHELCAKPHCLTELLPVGPNQIKIFFGHVIYDFLDDFWKQFVGTTVI
jgi:hypothetical protein